MVLYVDMFYDILLNHVKCFKLEYKLGEIGHIRISKKMVWDM